MAARWWLWICSVGHSLIPLRVAALPLAAWLQGLQVDLPDLPVASVPLVPPTPLGRRVDIDVSGGTCSGLRLGGVRVQRASSEPQDLRADFSVTGLGVECRITADASIVGGLRPLKTSEVVANVDVVNGSVGGGLRLLLVAEDGAGAAAPLPLPWQAELEDCTVRLGDVQLRFSGGGGVVGDAVAAVLNLLGSRFLDPVRLNEVICGAARALVAGRLSRALRNASEALERSGLLAPGESLPEPALGPEATDLHELLGTGPLGHVAQDFAEHELHVSEPSRLDQVLRRVAALLRLRPPAGLLRPVSLAWPLPVGLLSVGVGWRRCSGLAPRVEGGTRPHVLDLWVEATGAACAVELDLRLDLGVAGVRTAGALTLRAKAAAGADSLGAGGSLLLGLDGARALRDFRLDQLQHLGCFVRALDPAPAHGAPPLMLLDMQASFTPRAFNLTTRGGDDPLADQLLQALTVLVAAGSPALAPTLSTLLKGRGLDMLRDRANGALLNATRAPPPCPASNFSTGLYEPLALTSRALAGSLSAAGGLVAVLALLLAVRRGRACMRWALCGGASPPSLPLSRSSLFAGSAAEPLALLAGSLEEFRLRGTLEELPLARRQDAASKATSYAMTLLTLSVAAMFLVSSTDAQVSLQVLVEDAAGAGAPPRRLKLQSIMDFTMWKVAVNFWQSDCYLLLLFVVLWSVAWPFAKLILMLFCWHAPTRTLSRKRRGQLLIFLRRIGKWSLADPFLFSIFLVSLRLEWRDAQAVRGGTTRVIIECCAHAGFYMLFLGTVCSLALGEVMLVVHRRTRGGPPSAPAAPPLRRRRSEPAALARSPGRRRSEPARLQASPAMVAAAAAAPAAAPQRTRVDAGQRRRASSGGDCRGGGGGGDCDGHRRASARLLEAAAGVGVLALVVAVLPLTALGLTSTAFACDYGGVIGAVKLVVGQPLAVSRSLLSVIGSLPGPPDGDFFGEAACVFLRLCLLWFVVGAPLLLGALLLASRAPLPAALFGDRARRGCARLCRALPAWSGLDVFAAALVVSIVGGDSFGIASFVAFTVKDGTLQPVCTYLEESVGVACVSLRLRALDGLCLVLVAVAVQALAPRLLPRFPVAPARPACIGPTAAAGAVGVAAAAAAA